jgi:myo-inositol 2-dehydrogenase / D-chiro-inositol 1-dehydrogenase
MIAKTLRIGIIGTGRMGHAHAEFLREEADVQVTALCNLTQARADEMAGPWGARVYTSYEEMLDGEELDGVYICTPTYNHGEIALACLERDLPTFLEKPVELDLPMMGALLRTAQARRSIVAVSFHWRYTRACEEARRLIGDDPIALVNLRWYWTRPPVRWMWKRALAGGQIVDQNIHLIDLSQALAGEIESVYACYNERQTNFDENFDNWDGYALTFRYKKGAVGNCAGTYALYPQIQDRPTADFALRDCLLRITDQGLERMRPDGVDCWENQGGFRAGVNRAFIEAVRSGDPSPIRAGLWEGIRSTAVVLAANHSARTGQPVNVDQFIAQRVGEIRS